MWERLLIVILICSAMIFPPYFVGSWLTSIKVLSFGTNVFANWISGVLTLALVSVVFTLVVLILSKLISSLLIPLISWIFTGEWK